MMDVRAAVAYGARPSAWSASRAVRAAATSTTAAKIAQTALGPATPITALSTSGPTIRPTPSAVAEIELAAVNCSGVSARSGRIALWTGRVSVTAQAETTAAMYATGAGAHANAAPRTDALMACVR